MTMKAEIGGMRLQAKECQALPGERQGTNSPSEPREGTNPANTLISNIQPPEL